MIALTTGLPFTVRLRLLNVFDVYLMSIMHAFLILFQIMSHRSLTRRAAWDITATGIMYCPVNTDLFWSRGGPNNPQRHSLCLHDMTSDHGCGAAAAAALF